MCARVLAAVALVGAIGGALSALQPAHADDPPAPDAPEIGVLVRGVETPSGRTFDLELERFEVLPPDARVIVADADGQYEMDRPDVALYRGVARGEPGSRVFIAVTGGTRGKVQGFVQTREALQVVHGADGLAGRLSMRDARTPDADEARDPGFCAVDALNGAGWWPEPSRVLGEGSEPACRVAKIAVDTDWEFTQLFQGDTQASAAYAVTLMAAVSEIYRRDLNVRLSVPYLRVWADNSDPYGGAAPLYGQFSAYWNAHMRGVERHAAHLLSGRLDQVLAGEASVASLGVLDDAYGVSSKIKGTFPYPLVTQSNLNWDVYIVAHEIGHNFGSVHTHEYTPPIDGCGVGNCAGADQGTIMSYCQACPGGVANIRLQFHPRVVTTILDYLDSAPCDLIGDGNKALDDEVHAVASLPMLVDVLMNDETASCDTLRIESFDAVSEQGGKVELVTEGLFGRQRLRYTAPLNAGDTDSFNYTITGGVSGTVRAQIQPLRWADLTGAISPGVKASYFVLTVSPTQMPDFATLSAYLGNVSAMLNYPSTNAPFASSGRENLVGAVFEGFIDAPTSGVYTISLASDDGSRLYLGPDLLIDNDGVHTMLERSAAIGLSAGKHAVRLEFFERSGPAGLVVSWSGPGIAKQPIPAARWFRRIPCPGDRNLDAKVNVDDLNAVLGQWGMAVVPLTGGDETGDGLVNVNDLNVVLGHWGASCP